MGRTRSLPLFGSVLALFAAAPVTSRTQGAACSGVGRPGEYRRSVGAGREQRDYILYVPRNYSPARRSPLVLNMHGAGGTAEIQEKLTGFNAAAEKHGFLVVYPEGTLMLVGRGRTWNSGGCCGTAGRRAVDDVAFLSRIIADVSRDYCIDERRIYATGMSNGAMMAYRLACEMSDRIAAVAPVSGTMQVENCRPIRPVSVMHFHGTADDRIPYAGGKNAFGNWTSVSDTIRFWQKQDGCAANPKQDIARGEVSCVNYAPCGAGAEVVLCVVNGGGHSWPGAVGIRQRGHITGDVSATDAISDFFLRHEMPR